MSTAPASSGVHHFVAMTPVDGAPSANYLADFEARGQVAERFNISDSSLKILQREVAVWLPHGYDSTDRHHPVIYQFDGQTVFLNGAGLGGSLLLDRLIESELMSKGKLPPIVVTIGNGPDQDRYFQFTQESGGRFKNVKDAEGKVARVEEREGRCVQNMAQWVATVLVPLIDSGYRTVQNASARVISGISLASFAAATAAINHPDVFGHAMVLSPGLWGENSPDGGHSIVDQVIVKRQEGEVGANRPHFYLGLGSDEGAGCSDSGTLGADNRLTLSCVVNLELFRRGLLAAGWWRDEVNAWFFRGCQHNEVSFRHQMATIIPHIFNGLRDFHTGGPSGATAVA